MQEEEELPGTRRQKRKRRGFKHIRHRHSFCKQQTSDLQPNGRPKNFEGSHYGH